MREWRRKSIAAVALAAMVSGPATSAAGRSDHNRDRDRDGRTATPIKHVIVIIGENRTFDNLYGTYIPRRGQRVSNLLSRGIVRPDGTPGPQSAIAEQSRLTTINPVTYFVNTDTLVAPGKAPYAPFLPTPEAGSAPPRAVTLTQFLNAPAVAAPPFDGNSFSAARLHQISPVLEVSDLRLLTTGATGLTNCTPDPALRPSPQRAAPGRGCSSRAAGTRA